MHAFKTIIAEKDIHFVKPYFFELSLLHGTKETVISLSKLVFDFSFLSLRYF